MSVTHRPKDYVEDYKGIVPLYLEVCGYKFFVDPYGPVYLGAIGKVYSTSKSYGITHLIRTDSVLDAGEHHPVDFITQEEDLIVVKINYEHNPRDWDRHNRNGLEVKLYPWKVSDKRK